MSEKNGKGVIRIPRMGIVEFAFGEDGLCFTIDVIAVHDEWYVVDHSLRDESGKVPVEQTLAYGQQKLAFVQNVVNEAYGQQHPNVVNEAYGQQHPRVEPPVLTHAEAGAFIARLSAKVEELLDFFAPSTPGRRSSPESTEVRFSQ